MFKEARQSPGFLLPVRYQAIESPRHKVQISENVAKIFRNESLAELKLDLGDEVVTPVQQLQLLFHVREHKVQRSLFKLIECTASQRLT